MQIEIININNTCILKTWCRHFARHTGLHCNHCVSPYVQLIGFPDIPPDTQIIFLKKVFQRQKACKVTQYAKS